MGGICYQAHSNCSHLFPSLRTPSVMSKQAFAVRQGERELRCLWQMKTIRVSLFHVSCGRNFSMLLSNRGKRCQRVRDEVSTVFIKLRRYISTFTSLSLSQKSGLNRYSNRERVQFGINCNALVQSETSHFVECTVK